MSEAHESSNFGDGNFFKFVSRERDRLRASREQVFNQQEELQRRLDAVNREFTAIDAYKTAKTGKAARCPQADRQPRVRRSSRREVLLEMIRQNDGLSCGEILERMGLKGDKSGEMSVLNALATLTKSNQVHREGGNIAPPCEAEFGPMAAIPQIHPPLVLHSDWKSGSAQNKCA